MDPVSKLKVLPRVSQTCCLWSLEAHVLWDTPNIAHVPAAEIPPLAYGLNRTAKLLFTHEENTAFSMFGNGNVSVLRATDRLLVTKEKKGRS